MFFVWPCTNGILNLSLKRARAVFTVSFTLTPSLFSNYKIERYSICSCLHTINKIDKCLVYIYKTLLFLFKLSSFLSHTPKSCLFTPNSWFSYKIMNGETTIKAGSAMSVLPSRRLPDFRISISLKYVKLGYHYLITHLLQLALVPLTAVLFVEATRIDPNDLLQVWLLLKYNILAVLTLFALLVTGCMFYFLTRSKPVYLIEFTCYKPPALLEVGFEDFLYHSRIMGFNDSALEFQRKILVRSGLSEHTHVPEAVKCIPPQPTMINARTEAENVTQFY